MCVYMLFPSWLSLKLMEDISSAPKWSLLERWAEELSEIQQRQMQVLHLRRNNPGDQYRMRVICWKTALWRRIC